MKEKSRIIVLLYHRILPKRRFDPFNMMVTTKTFIKQLETAAKKYPVISLNDAVNQFQSGRLKVKTQVVLTFDDGYRDNYEIAFPILKRKGVPAAFFLAAGYISRNRALWDCGLINLLNCNRMINEVKINGQIIRHRTNEPRILFIIRALEKFKSESIEAINKAMDFLIKQPEYKFALDNREDGCMSWEQAKRMSQNGMEIGSHSLFHRSLSGIPFEEARYEINASKEAIEEGIQKPCAHFAFPFGARRDYDYGLICYLKKAGFKTCHLNEYGYNTGSKDNFCFRRIIVKEFFDAAVL